MAEPPPSRDTRAMVSTSTVIDIAYGKGALPVRVPGDCDITVIRQLPMAPIPEPSNAVRKALRSPVAAPPLATLARGKRSACILVCDITRPVPNHLFLRPIIQTLLKAGIKASNVTVLVATGLHRPAPLDEIVEIVGDPWVLDTVSVENHHAQDDAAHIHLGETPDRKTPVRLDRRFVEADLRIATGLVEPHFMAGWSGGRKVVAPGVAHAETIRTFHNASFMENPAAFQCNLKGNPLHEEMLEVIRMVGDVHAVNTVIDENRSLCFVNFGEVVASHAEAVAFMEQACVVPVERTFRTVVTSAAGYPLDATYYQTVKAMVTALDIIEPGANLIVASACSEGLGSQSYREAQQRLVDEGPEGFLASIATKTLADVDEWQTEMQLKPERVATIHLYTDGLPKADRALTGVHMIKSVDAAIRDSIESTGDKSVAVIPDGPYVVPQLIR